MNFEYMTFEEINEDYLIKWNDVRMGIISEQSWIDYCSKVWPYILEHNKDVLERLKYR